MLSQTFFNLKNSVKNYKENESVSLQLFVTLIKHIKKFMKRKRCGFIKLFVFNTIRKTGHSKQQVWLGVIDVHVLILNGETKALTGAEVNKERLLRDIAVPVDYSHADDGPLSL